MSTYQTLLGAHRMSSSASVLPPPWTPTRQQQHPHTAYGVAVAATTTTTTTTSATLINYRVQQVRDDVAADVPRASVGSINKATPHMMMMTMAAAIQQPLAPHRGLISPNTVAPAVPAQLPSRQPLQQVAAAHEHQQRYADAAQHHAYDHHQYMARHYAAAPKASTASATSSSSRPSSAASSASASASASSRGALTQADRSGATSNRTAQLMQQANHHRQRSAMYRPKWNPELRRHPLQHRPLLLLDLDETLVHASTHRPHGPNGRFDVQFDVDMGANQPPVPVWVAIRPFAREFLFDVSSYFEVAVFTASIKNYADKVVEALDPQGRFVHHRLYRDHCSDVDGTFVKDLALLGRPLHRVAILDNSPHAYLFHPENSIPILSWFDDPADRELQKVTPMLIQRLAKADEVYDVLNDYRENM